MTTILLIILSIAYIVLSAVIDAEHIVDEDYIESHVSRVLLRFVFLCTVAMVSIQASVGATFIYIAIFDQVLNRLTKKKFWYLGTVAKWDIFWKKHMVTYKIVKALSLLIGLTLFIWQ